MINQHHPIIPPEDLLQQLRHSADTWLGQITIAYQAGADQELEACCEWLDHNSPSIGGFHLRIDRRPKPPSLKEEARQIIDCLIEGACLNDDDAVRLRRVLEALPND